MDYKQCFTILLENGSKYSPFSFETKENTMSLAEWYECYAEIEEKFDTKEWVVINHFTLKL